MGRFKFKRGLKRPDVIYFPFSTLNFDSYVQLQNSFKKKDHHIDLLYYLVTSLCVLLASLVKRTGTRHPPLRCKLT